MAEAQASGRALLANRGAGGDQRGRRGHVADAVRRARARLPGRRRRGQAGPGGALARPAAPVGDDRSSAARRRGRRRGRDPRWQRVDRSRDRHRGTRQPGLRAACPVLARASRNAQQPDPHRPRIRSAHALRRGAQAAGMAESGEAGHRHLDRRHPASAVWRTAARFSTGMP